VTEYET